ncbi:MAG: hypothetical protein Q8Q09_06815 [Deltaproteobacteria bacterium]|nr:hypothetical protein [Deltaproteobacteria bacterium]
MFATVFTVGCRTSATQTAPPAGPAVAAGGDQQGAQRPDEPVLVQGIEPLRTPQCAAGEITSLTSLSPGIDPAFALARSPTGGLVSWVRIGRAGARELMVMPLGPTGAPAGDAQMIAGAQGADFPALVALERGYVLAWVDRPASGERVLSLRLDEAGAQQPWTGRGTSTPAGDPVASAGLLEGTAAGRQFAAPSLARDGSQVVLIAAQQTTSATVMIVQDLLGQGSVQTVPEALDLVAGERVIALQNGTQTRWLASRGEHTLLLGNGASFAPIARGVSGATMMRVDGGWMTAWSTQQGVVTQVRAQVRPDEGEPTTPRTLAAYERAPALNVALVRFGSGLFGALSLSQLADDATGSINLSLVDSHGRFVGRHASMASLRLRSSRTVAAGAAGPRGEAWVLLDGRADDGSAVLGMVSVSCSSDVFANEGAMPTASMLQRASPPEAPTLTADRRGGAALCSPAQDNASAGIELATHTAGGEDLTAEASARGVQMADGRVVFFARRRVSAERVECVAPSLGSDQRVVARDGVPCESDLTVLDAGAVGPWAIAVTQRSVLRSAGRGEIARSDLSLGGVYDARVLRGGSAILALTEGTSSAMSGLYYLPLVRGVPTRPVHVARVQRGVIEDAVVDGGRVRVLLSSFASANGASAASTAARTRALLTFDPRDRELANRAQHNDPFTDPLAVGAGPAALVGLGNAMSLLWWDRGVLRTGRIDHGVIREPHSVYGVLDQGGEALSIRHTGEGDLTVAFSANPVQNQDESLLPHPVLLRIGDAGAVTALSVTAPSDRNALVRFGVSALSHGSQMTALYTVARGNTLRWMAQRLSCAQSAPTTRPAAAGASR